jgi:hypothetical protein
LNFATEKSETIACTRICRSSLLKGGGHEKYNWKKWRAEEEERHKGSLITPHPQKIQTIKQNV